MDETGQTRSLANRIRSRQDVFIGHNHIENGKVEHLELYHYEEAGRETRQGGGGGGGEDRGRMVDGIAAYIDMERITSVVSVVSATRDRAVQKGMVANAVRQSTRSSSFRPSAIPPNQLGFLRFCSTKQSNLGILNLMSFSQCFCPGVF